MYILGCRARDIKKNKLPNFLDKDYLLLENKKIEAFNTTKAGNYLFSVIPRCGIIVMDLDGNLISSYEFEDPLEEDVHEFLVKDNNLFGFYSDTTETYSTDLHLFKFNLSDYNHYLISFDTSYVFYITGLLDVDWNNKKIISFANSINRVTDGFVEIDFNARSMNIIKEFPLGTIYFETMKRFGNYFLATSFQEIGDLEYNFRKLYCLYWDGKTSSDVQTLWTIDLADLGFPLEYRFLNDFKQYKDKFIVRFGHFMDTSSEYISKNRFLIIDKSGNFTITEETQINFIYIGNIKYAFTYKFVAPSIFIPEVKRGVLYYDNFKYSNAGTALYGYKMRRLGYKAI